MATFKVDLQARDWEAIIEALYNVAAHDTSMRFTVDELEAARRRVVAALQTQGWVIGPDQLEPPPASDVVLASPSPRGQANVDIDLSGGVIRFSLQRSPVALPETMAVPIAVFELTNARLIQMRYSHAAPAGMAFGKGGGT